jgi:hypothetical protein
MTLARKIELLRWYSDERIILNINALPISKEVNLLQEYITNSPQKGNYLSLKGKMFLAVNSPSGE